MHFVMQKIYRLTSWLALGLKGDSQKQIREHFDGINCCQSELNLLHSPSTDSTDSTGCSRLCSSTSVVSTRPAASASLARICSGPSDCCNDNPRPVICRGCEVSQAEPRPVFAARCVDLAWHSSSTSTSALGVWSTLQLHHVAIIPASQRRWLKLKGFTPIICRRMRPRFLKAEGFFFFFYDLVIFDSFVCNCGYFIFPLHVRALWRSPELRWHPQVYTSANLFGNGAPLVHIQ